MALEGSEEEGLVLAVINVRNSDRSSGRGAHFVIGKRIARNDRVRKRGGLAAAQLLEVLPVYEFAVEIAVFGAAVELVGPAPHDAGELPAGAVAVLGRESRGVHLELLDHVQRGSHNRIEVVRVSQDRFLGVDAVNGEA